MFTPPDKASHTAVLRFSQLVTTYEKKMTWYMRWFALSVLSVGYLTSVFTGAIGFCISRDAHFLVFISPTVFTPAIFSLVPMDQKQYELKKLKIQLRAQFKTQPS